MKAKDKTRELKYLQNKANMEYYKFERTCAEISNIIEEYSDIDDLKVDMMPYDGLCLQVDMRDGKAPYVVPIDSIINAIGNSLEINREIIRKLGI